MSRLNKPVGMMNKGMLLFFMLILKLETQIKVFSLFFGDTLRESFA